MRALVEKKENGSINWTAGVVEARGTGIPPTYTYYGQHQANQEKILAQATRKARHNLLEIFTNRL